MAAVVQLTWDLPSAEKLEAYVAKATQDWIPSSLRVPGLRRMYALRNSIPGNPHVTTIYEFDSLDNAYAFVRHPEMKRVMADMYGAGVKGLRLHIWEPSPAVPDGVLTPEQ